jgi:CRP-like cAMP-binding protein
MFDDSFLSGHAHLIRTVLLLPFGPSLFSHIFVYFILHFHIRFATQFGEGDTFGQLAVLDMDVRAHTVVAKVSTFCLKLDRAMYEKYWKPKYNRSFTTIVKFLRTVEPYSHLGRREFATIAYTCQV